MGDVVLEQQALAAQIEDPQPPLAGGQREVDHRQAVGSLGAMIDGALHGRKGMGQDLLVEFRGAARQLVGQRRGGNRRQQRHTGQTKPGGEQ